MWDWEGEGGVHCRSCEVHGKEGADPPACCNYSILRDLTCSRSAHVAANTRKVVSSHFQFS